ncbi:hypothetical protein JZ751_001613 [Albula glossodonta]|uniref:Uncharacterized protein n=1 Tax=Albula glossodonta TaxID=121402 RepID=A0A8T2PU62_9TELE|nr:hypothetical protein JZ751_001613 [Albula glossodonta]
MRTVTLFWTRGAQLKFAGAASVFAPSAALMYSCVAHGSDGGVSLAAVSLGSPLRLEGTPLVSQNHQPSPHSHSERRKRTLLLNLSSPCSSLSEALQFLRTV